eukprot:7556888-Heterocapsa_arctica.AAC.1
MVVPSRPLTRLEWACVDDTHWGAAVFQFVAALLGMLVTSPYAWHRQDKQRARNAQRIEIIYLLYLPAIKQYGKGSSLSRRSTSA